MKNRDSRLGNVRFMVFGIVLILLAAMWLISRTVR
jgi:hypothetical protein